MAKTVFITGASSGIGKATVELFLAKGWQVVATMRNPEVHSDMNHRSNVLLLPLDVTDPLSISRAVEGALNRFGTIDVLVNNAGFGTMGAFELATEEQMIAQFNTNVFGSMRLVKAILPTMRAQKSGTIINITSVAGRITSPLYSLYCSSKFAVEGFTEALYYELRPWNIKLKLVEPGPIKTEFNGRSKMELNENDNSTYADIHKKVKCFYDKLFGRAEQPEVVAKTIFKAASSTCYRLRYPAGVAGKFMLAATRIMPLWKLRWLQRTLMGL
jgi:NAD(P)-dependent dehydrogenase (short-subunit alcohol dehydrogenase family)